MLLYSISWPHAPKVHKLGLLDKPASDQFPDFIEKNISILGPEVVQSYQIALMSWNNFEAGLLH